MFFSQMQGRPKSAGGALEGGSSLVSQGDASLATSSKQRYVCEQIHHTIARALKFEIVISSALKVSLICILKLRMYQCQAFSVPRASQDSSTYAPGALYIFESISKLDGDEEKTVLKHYTLRDFLGLRLRRSWTPFCHLESGKRMGSYGGSQCHQRQRQDLMSSTCRCDYTLENLVKCTYIRIVTSSLKKR